MNHENCEVQQENEFDGMQVTNGRPPERDDASYETEVIPMSTDELHNSVRGLWLSPKASR
jgi:hypothetical protein